MEQAHKEPQRRHKVAGRFIRRSAQVAKAAVMVPFYALLMGIALVHLATHQRRDDSDE
jgi:hypothetical protein